MAAGVRHRRWWVAWRRCRHARRTGRDRCVRKRRADEYLGSGSAEVTHAHPAAIDGARLIALATHHALVSPAPPNWHDRTRLAALLAGQARTDELAAGLRSAPPAPGAAIRGTASEAVPAAGIVGAHLGLAAIPGRLVDRLEDHGLLIELADNLLEVAIRSHGPSN